MSQLPRYESYKDSGVQWLGGIPSHWAVVRLDQGCEIVRGNTGFSKADLLEEGQYVALQYGKTYKVDEINNTFSSYVNEEFYKLSQIAMYGDTVLISTSETIEDLGHSCFYARQDIGLIGGEQFLLKVNQGEKFGKYLYYLSKAFSGYLRKYATGTKVYRFNTDHLKKIYIPQIPFNEQKIIADFLDKRLAQVDALIAKQETLLEKLAEQRVALISHAVTKGLNPDVEMKESGVEWLGEVPSHWVVKKLKFLTSYFKGFAFKSEDFSDIGVPLIKASNVKKFSIENVESHIAFDKVQDAFDRVKLQEGDLILSTVGSLPNVVNSAVGQIAYVSPNFSGSYLNQNNVCFRSNEKVLSVFLKYFVMSSFFRRNLDIKALWIANQAYLEVLDVQNISIIFPSLDISIEPSIRVCLIIS